MRGFDAEERYWIENNWTATSRSVLKIIVPLAVDVVDEIAAGKDPAESTWRRFVDKAARALDRARDACSQAERPGGLPPRSTMYATAISLLGESEPMKDELIRAGDKLRGPKAGAIVWASLRSGLYRMRMQASSDTENRARTWRRLQPIVAAVRDRQRFAGRDERFSIGACEAIAEHVRLHHPDDHSLPREAEKVKRFFAEFCEDFFEPEEVYDVTEEDVELLPDMSRARAFLADCAELLTGQHDEVYRASRVVDGSVQAFCLKLGLSRRKFYHLLDEAYAQLDKCIRGKFAAHQWPVTP